MIELHTVCVCRYQRPPKVTGSQFVWIEFHCLLYTQQWWFDDSSKVYILFAAKELGNFEYCHGPMNKLEKKE